MADGKRLWAGLGETAIRRHVSKGSSGSSKGEVLAVKYSISSSSKRLWAGRGETAIRRHVSEGSSGSSKGEVLVVK